MYCDAVWGLTWDAIKFLNHLGYQELRVDEKKMNSEISEAILMLLLKIKI